MAIHTKQNQQPKPVDTYIRLGKHRGTIYFSKDAKLTADQIERYAFDFIDRNIAPPSCKGQVVAVHHGHDHGFGIFHKHHYKKPEPENLGQTVQWVVSLDNFLNDVHMELLDHYGSSPAFLTHAFVKEFIDETS